ncbi:MAG TPA: NusG domain II-containing protein [Gammaproteobacteria bacterium]|nr:NusG domain II-containing protein [Gammaproteobacteria bacterium]
MKGMTPADAVVIIAAAVVVAACYGVFWTGGGAGEYALVHSDDAVARFALDGERVVAVAGRLGPSVIEIAPGRVRFAASPCRGKICLHAGWQSTAGAAAACLPNRITLEVVGAERVYDSINF